MKSQSEKAQLLRTYHENKETFVIPNPWDIGSARLLALAGSGRDIHLIWLAQQVSELPAVCGAVLDLGTAMATFCRVDSGERIPLTRLDRLSLPRATAETSDGLLKHLSMLFVPAGVGVVQQLDLLGEEGGRLLAVIVLSTIIALAVTALTFAAVARLMGVSGEEEREEPAE